MLSQRVAVTQLHNHRSFVVVLSPFLVTVSLASIPEVRYHLDNFDHVCVSYK